MIMLEVVVVNVVFIMCWVIFVLMLFVVFFNGIINLILCVFKVLVEWEDIVIIEDIVVMMDVGVEYGSL